MNRTEEIRASIDNMDYEVLKDTVAILLSNNVTVSSSTAVNPSSDYKNFAQAIIDLKNKYNFHELDLFSTEADLVYVQAGDRRILLTDKENNTDSSANQKTLNENDPENAFENIKKSDNRFSRLEL